MKIQSSLLLARAKQRLETVNREIADRKRKHDNLEKEMLCARAAVKAAETHFLRQLAKYPGNAITGVDTAVYAPSISFGVERLHPAPSHALADLRKAKQDLDGTNKRLNEAKETITQRMTGSGRSAWPNEAMVLARQARSLTELIETLKSTKIDGEIMLPAKTLAAIFPEFA